MPETDYLTPSQRESLRSAIEADLRGLTSLGRDGAPSAEWVAWFLTNGWPRRTPFMVDSIIAEHITPPGESNPNIGPRTPSPVFSDRRTT